MVLTHGGTKRRRSQKRLIVRVDPIFALQPFAAQINEEHERTPVHVTKPT
jgi:hypothetical protein